MFVFTNFLSAVAYVIEILLNIYMWIVIARALISWVNPDPYNPIVRLLYQVTEPVMALVRRWIPFRGMGIDLSPMIILLAIIFLQSFLVPSLMQLGYSFR